MRRVQSIAGALMVLVGAVLVQASCGGSVVYDAPDPTACGTGHGCPMAGCSCGDGTVVLDTTCESGDCIPVEEVCADRCADRGGPIVGFGSENDEVPVPNCDTFCTRLFVNDCELGCDTLFSSCLKPSNCDQAASRFWRCVTEDAVLSCEDNALVIEGCDGSALGLCEK